MGNNGNSSFNLESNKWLNFTALVTADSKDVNLYRLLLLCVPTLYKFDIVLLENSKLKLLKMQK